MFTTICLSIQTVRRYVLTFIISDWVDVDHDNKLEFDIMTYPLQIETKSSLGSDDKVSVRFWGEGSVIGDLTITFGAEPTYSISPCTAIQMKFSSLPEDDIKFWTIKKKDNSLTLECNDVLVLEYVFESSEEAQCSVSWSQDVDSIMFLSVDTASVRFRGVGTGTLFKMFLVVFPLISKDDL